MLTAFATQFPRCWICGDRHQLHIHHIASGAGRLNDRRNLVRLCRGCHDEYIHTGVGTWHNNVLIANEYALKRLRDSLHYDRDWLNAARWVPNGGVTEDDVRASWSVVVKVVKW